MIQGETKKKKGKFGLTLPLNKKFENTIFFKKIKKYLYIIGIPYKNIRLRISSVYQLFCKVTH